MAKKKRAKRVKKVKSVSRKASKTVLSDPVKVARRMRIALYNFVVFLALTIVILLILAYVSGKVLVTTLMVLALVTGVLSLTFLLVWLIFLVAAIRNKTK